MTGWSPSVRGDRIGPTTEEVSDLSASQYTSSGSFGSILADVTEMAQRALRDYGEWLGRITPNARLDTDLGMQSVEFAALQGYLTQNWGAAADLGPLLRTLDLAGLSDLTVETVAAYVAGRLAAS